MTPTKVERIFRPDEGVQAAQFLTDGAHFVVKDSEIHPILERTAAGLKGIADEASARLPDDVTIAGE